MSNFEDLLSKYDYAIDVKNIANEPASPRDSAKLLVYDRITGDIVQDSYLHIDRYLPKGAILVFNETRVIPARLVGRVATGGKAELLCTRFGIGELYALCERGLEKDEHVWVTKKGALRVMEKIAKEYRMEIPSDINIRSLLQKRGVTPLPPYLKHSKLTESERRRKYQTTFAKHEGSIAAPTASLHFTPRLFQKLRDAGIQTAFITLHVNLGTFMPLTAENVESGHLHSEFYEIPAKSLDLIKHAKANNLPIIPVGTTALRALESAFKGNDIVPKGETRLFIREGYTFKIADGLITNFHVPKSSLMMLVAALIGRKKLLQLYSFALKHGYRFFSFGDGMLIR